ncbi:hypothetical protein T484DRAFT_1974795 [Baffinella frigidus]|nr:hypothetical protein T484DRAFT_1974795 [Cryptophyta sp. CCMP2293]|mmetsp:Transcript_37568/g.88882  ORF Transcript_37568/g.88882 Transcript_37568/m.88882 type:complete len:115 (+) Transcript_37568:64-408(+)
MPDTTAKLPELLSAARGRRTTTDARRGPRARHNCISELLSAVRGRRTLDDAGGVLGREPSTKTILTTTNSRSFSSDEENPDGGQSCSLLRRARQADVTVPRENILRRLPALLLA